jgi:hypothetical protein
MKLLMIFCPKKVAGKMFRRLPRVALTPFCVRATSGFPLPCAQGEFLERTPDCAASVCTTVDFLPPTLLSCVSCDYNHPNFSISHCRQSIIHGFNDGACNCRIRLADWHCQCKYQSHPKMPTKLTYPPQLPNQRYDIPVSRRKLLVRSLNSSADTKLLQNEVQRSL